ncbi:hypothetical protein JW911_00015 [Candidatus Peregrinibacteria bacterium]|nr:hypothetical protein [Candidatus Peregrinibacteria bacterium]
MKSILLKVNDKVNEELETIQELEGLNSRTSTITFLIKYYLLTKGRSFDATADLFEKALSKVDWENLPSPEDQLKKLK